MSLVLALLGALRAALRTRTDLTLENLALRQQLALLRRRSKRPKFGLLDRAFWMWLSQWWTRWSEVLHVVKPRTVIRWHRQSFRAFWTWKSRRGRVGRPRVGAELADLVRTMTLANPLWGSPRIHGVLLKLGFNVSQRTVARLMPRRPKPPSQTWRTFLQNHVADLVSVDFFVVPTATFRLLYVFVVLLQHRRKVVQSNVTDSPTAVWTAQQIVEAFTFAIAEGMLFPKPIARKVRFHDLRHTTATLLLKEGVPLATVQRVLRHTDPRLTTEIYGHLDVEDMRAGLDRLRIATPSAPQAVDASPLQNSSN